MYNMNNPSIKRIMREVKEMNKDINPHYTAKPLEDNLFEWHFTIRGPPDSPFENGIYHGRIILPADYPFKPPNIVLLTPNGRFEVNKKICLSMSAYHPEFWQPGWSIRTVLVALIGFMPSKGEGAIGALDYTPEERIVMAKQSLEYKCPLCGSCNREALPEETEEDRQKIQEQIDETKSQIPQAPPATDSKEEAPSVSGAIAVTAADPSATIAPGMTMEIPEAQVMDQIKTEQNEDDQRNSNTNVNIEDNRNNILEGQGPRQRRNEERQINNDDQIVAPVPTQKAPVMTEEEYQNKIAKRRLDIAINIIVVLIFLLLARSLFH